MQCLLPLMEAALGVQGSAPGSRLCAIQSELRRSEQAATVCKEEESTCERGVPEGDGRGTACSPLCWEEAGLGTTQGPATSHQHRLSPFPWVKKYTRETAGAAPAPSHSHDGRGWGELNEKERHGGMPGCNWLSGGVLVSGQVLSQGCEIKPRLGLRAQQ